MVLALHFFFYIAKVSVVSKAIRSEIVNAISVAMVDGDQLGIARDVHSCLILRLKGWASADCRGPDLASRVAPRLVQPGLQVGTSETARPARSMPWSPPGRREGGA